MKALRPYQSSCIDALWSYWAREESGDGLLVVPTGAGKSLIMAEIIRRVLDADPEARILVLAHVKELLQQNHDEIKGHLPACPVGIYSAGIGRKELHAGVTVAGIQSIEKQAGTMPVPDIIMMDEAHLMPRDSGTRYKKVMSILRERNPHVRIIGLTATPYRLDSGWLHKGDGAVFDDIIYEVPVQDLITMGYLSPIIAVAGGVELDTKGVQHQGREFAAGALEARAMEGNFTEAAIEDLVARTPDRKKLLIFACGIDHAARIKALLDEHGCPAALISGETPKAERDRIIDDFSHDIGLEPIRALVNVNVLTTGFNAPRIDAIAMMRPTESPGLYVQMIGRGMRRAEGKTECVVFDYAGNVLRHGPIDAIRPQAKAGDGTAEPVLKKCPECLAYVAAGCLHCPECGHEFPPRKPKVQETPVGGAILKAQEEEYEFDVTWTEYSLHQKRGRPDSVKIEYSHRTGTIAEWIFPESDTEWGQFFYRKACHEMGLHPYPQSAESFLAQDLPQASKITARKDGKWWRVKSHVWKKIEEKEAIPFCFLLTDYHIRDSMEFRKSE